MNKSHFAVLMVVSLSLASFAEAGVGGRGGSFGSRGSRGFSAPRSAPNYQGARPYTAPRPQAPLNRDNSYRQPAPPTPAPAFGGGGFGRGLMGGLAGGFLGSMLFSRLGGGGYGGMGGGMGGYDTGYRGPGFLEILILAGLGYWLYRRFVARRQPTSGDSAGYDAQGGYDRADSSSSYERPGVRTSLSGAGADGIQGEFKELMEFGTSLFFRVQSAWSRGDLHVVQSQMTPSLYQTFQQSLDELKASGKLNHLENIAIREAEVPESWSENGDEYATLHLRGQMLDYLTDLRGGGVLEGDSVSPVPFEEYWTFVRPEGSGSAWMLTAVERTENASGVVA